MSEHTPGQVSDCLSVKWLSANRPPKCPPDPNYPNGMYADATMGQPGCETRLPYPAPCVGKWLIKCQVCGFTAIVTAAGRPDDAHTVKIPCKIKGLA